MNIARKSTFVSPFSLPINLTIHLIHNLSHVNDSLSYCHSDDMFAHQILRITGIIWHYVSV